MENKTNETKPKKNLYVLEEALEALKEAKENIKAAQKHARRMSIAVDAAKKREKENVKNE